MNHSFSLFIANNLSFFAFVAFILVGLISILREQSRQKKSKEKLQSTIEKNLIEPLSLHPKIDPELCAGCGACVRVCPEGEILQIINNRAVLVEPTRCLGHGECERSCPFSAITLVFGTKSRGVELPRLNKFYESNVKGLYIAGELGGMGLIRNAVKQGGIAAKDACRKVTQIKADVDILVVGTGPAGISALLVCKEQGKRALAIEQNNFGGTIFNYPRQKVVMSHPLELPFLKEIKFAKNKVSKEELLELWNYLRKKAGIEIKEKEKLVHLEKQGEVFSVETSQGVISAQKVILAMGVRGAPRKLNVPGEELSKVTYNLIDPWQYQGKWVAVVGGGNAGVEAAHYLAERKLKNKVLLLVRSKTLDRCNAENQKLIEKDVENKRVKILYETAIQEIQGKEIIISCKNVNQTVPNDFVFIFAGAEMPIGFLKSLGIEVDKKFEEA